MRNKLLILLFISLLSLTTIVKSESVNIDDLVKSNINNEEVLYLEITSSDNLDKLSQYKNVKKILIKNLNILDISFINNLDKLEELTIYYSKVNLDNFNNSNLKKLEIFSSFIIKDNLSPLKNSKIEYLDLEGSYIRSIETIKYLNNLKELYLSNISNLYSLEPILSLKNLKKLDFGGSEELITDKVFDYIRKNNITGTSYQSKDYTYLLGTEYNKKLDDIIKNLNLDELSDIEKIKKITIYVIDNISYDDDCDTTKGCSYPEISFNRVAKSLSGKGVCYHYALLTNKLLNKVGIKNYLVNGSNKDGIAHEWLNVYLDGKWYGLDPTWIDTYIGEGNKFKRTGKSVFFMNELTANSTFYNSHIPDTYIEKIIDINDVPITIEQIEKKTYEEESSIYNYVFIISIITLLIFVIYHIYNINKNTKNKKAHLK